MLLATEQRCDMCHERTLGFSTECHACATVTCTNCDGCLCEVIIKRGITDKEIN
jgi:hypothetical protein